MHQQFSVCLNMGPELVKHQLVDESALFQTFADLMASGLGDEITAGSAQLNYWLVLDYLDHWEIGCSFQGIPDCSAHFPMLLEVGVLNPDGSQHYS
jgi:hypothetical protein